jgi:hypothetical protein
VAAELESPTTEARAGQEVAFALVNNGPGRVGYGVAFRLELEEDGQWVDVPFGPENLAWPAVYLSLPTGGRFEQSIEVPKDARPGRYRIAKWIDGSDEPAAFHFTVKRGQAGDP